MASQDQSPTVGSVTSGQHQTPRSVWECKIGVISPVNLPAGCDFPMRRAVDAAFLSLAGVESDFIFSGWGAKLTESELAVVENRLPSEAHHREVMVRDAAPELLEALKLAQAALSSIAVQPSLNADDAAHWRANVACDALHAIGPAIAKAEGK